MNRNTSFDTMAKNIRYFLESSAYFELKLKFETRPSPRTHLSSFISQLPQLITKLPGLSNDIRFSCAGHKHSPSMGNSRCCDNQLGWPTCTNKMVSDKPTQHRKCSQTFQRLNIPLKFSPIASMFLYFHCRRSRHATFKVT